MPYMCMIANGPYVAIEGEDGCQCGTCLAMRAYEPPKNVIYVGTVPGGHNSSDPQYKFLSEFDKGLDDYKKAKGDGLQPESTTVAGVAKAYEQEAKKERAAKAMKKKYGSESPVELGVEV